MSSVVSIYLESKSSIFRLYTMGSKLDRIGMGVLRLGLIVVLLSIGALEFADYEADGIVPLVAKSPLYELSVSLSGSRVPPLHE